MRKILLLQKWSNSNLITLQSVCQLQMLSRYSQCFMEYWNNINCWMNMNMQVITGCQQGLSRNQFGFLNTQHDRQGSPSGKRSWGEGAPTSLTLWISPHLKMMKLPTLKNQCPFHWKTKPPSKKLFLEKNPNIETASNILSFTYKKILENNWIVCSLRLF